MIETGARTPAAKKKETPEVSMAAGMGLAGMATGLLMKTILNEEKKSQTLKAELSINGMVIIQAAKASSKA